MAKKKLTKEVYLKWYEDMLFWRKFEDMTSALYIQQKIRGFLHLYNGQEAVLAGSLLAMEPGQNDYGLPEPRSAHWPWGRSAQNHGRIAGQGRRYLAR